MEAVVEIPSPTPRDSETVVTALETAAVFRAKGDAAEALRWLQRAAESAGDDGDDERTLALARTAADLSRALHAPVSGAPQERASGEHTPPQSRRLPKPPLRSGSARPAEDDGEPPQAQSQPSHTPTPPPLNHRPPPAPSSRPLPLSPSGRPAYSAAPLSSRAPGPPASHPAPTSAQPYQPRFSAPSVANTVATRVELRASELPAFPNVDADAEADADAQRLTQPVPAPAHFADASAPRLRQAARVSVAASPNEPGLFLVRLLEDGAAPPGDSAEALMVLIDPSSTLFSD